LLDLLKRRRAALLCPAVAVVLTLGFAAASARGAGWHYVPTAAPPPPAGVAPAPYPISLGSVGQISFWSPSHGLLITGGSGSDGPVASGLYAYDGAGWHQLSTVCGGGSGRIAWAGKDEFWTIADQRAGQVEARQEDRLTSISLCHFLDGQVVGSYAMPLGQPDSYLEMDAAACFSPSDCWFGGEDGSEGSFHLHWNGSEVSAVYDPEDHAVTGMTNFQGKLYEGLAIGPEDSYLPSEDREHPAVIRTIAPEGPAPYCSLTGQTGTFCDVYLFSAATDQALPEYPKGAHPDALGGFDVASDGGPLGGGATQLWAGADPVRSSSQSGVAPLTILHQAQGSWTQVLPEPGGGSPLPAGVELGGNTTDRYTVQETEAGNSIAPQPGTESAWLSLRGVDPGSALVALLEAPHAEADGQESTPKVLEEQILPGPEEHLGSLGEAGPITCPAEGDCWMATTAGWLFHLGGESAREVDPYFESLISYRPLDDSVPIQYPIAPPPDDSLANQKPLSAAPDSSGEAPAAPVKRKSGKALVTHIKSRFVDRRVLVISFTLTAKAHVQLVGRRKSKVVAKTRDESLRAGRHVLSLSLNPADWPTKLQFKATPAGKSAPSSGGEVSSSGGSDTVST
jgi:hypothetical protein